MKSILITRNDELIEQDTQFIADIMALGADLCREIVAYPLPISLTGGFTEVLDTIREHVPTHHSPSGKFDLGEYVNPGNGQPIPGFGHRLIREFEDRQREALYEKTSGKISEDITLEREAFLTAVKPKPGKNIVEATHRVLAYINAHPNSAERCSGLLFLQNGALKSVDDVNELITAFHSVFATDYQITLYEAVEPLFEQLREIGQRFDSVEAIREGIFAPDLLWLLKVGTDGEIVPADPEDDDQSSGDIGGLSESGQRKPGRNTVFQF